MHCGVQFAVTINRMWFVCVFRLWMFSYVLQSEYTMDMAFEGTGFTIVIIFFSFDLDTKPTFRLFERKDITLHVTLCNVDRDSNLFISIIIRVGNQSKIHYRLIVNSFDRLTG
jgi:hypothetical protein